MRRRRKTLLSTIGITALLLAMSPFPAAANATPASTGSVDEVQLPSGAEAFVYVPDGLTLNSWTAPVVLVLADDRFTAVSARELAEESGLAAKAKADNAVITFVNPIGEGWGAADVTTYDQILSRLYIERPTPATWSDGRADGASNGRDAGYPVVYQGYPFRPYLIAEGAGADFVSTHLIDDGLTTPLAALGGWFPAGVMLFNTTAVPEAQYREWPAVIVNGSAAVNAKYTSLSRESHRLFVGTSPIVDGFDPSVIGARYDQLTSVRRVQLMAGGTASPADNASNNFIVDIGDYDALGISPEQVDLTLAPDRRAMYLSYVPDSVRHKEAGTVPLVMLFHGSGERADWAAMHTEWPSLAAKEKFIVVSVDDHIGQRTPGNMTTDQVVELMDDVFARYPAVDRTRVYATGFSAGSFRTVNLGTQRPDLFAAIAPVNGTANPTNTNEEIMMPTMLIGGQADALTSNFPSRAGGQYTGAINSTDRTLDHLFAVNDIRGGSYSYDTRGTSTWWGLTPDHVETIPAANGTSTFSVNSIASADGNVYTKLVDVSQKNHFNHPDETPLIWSFFEQFSRDADGGILIADAVRPDVVLVTPTGGDPLQKLQIQVDATDNVGLRRIVANVYTKTGTLVKSTQTAVTPRAKAGSHLATVALADGDYYVKYNAEDLAGNISKTSKVAFTIDGTKPVATIKEGTSFTVRSGSTYDLISFKLSDAGRIDRVELNGVVKDLTDNKWSDINFVRPGVFGGVKGSNTLVVFDVTGNTQTYSFTLN